MTIISAPDHLPIKLWADNVQIEEKAIQQLKNVAGLPFIFKHIAVMPDAHWGMGSTVGSVIATKGAIIPAAVGVDIGCVDKDSEFLSPKGWKKISEYNGEKVMQYDPMTKEGKFVLPENFINLPCEEFLHFHTKYGIDQMLSPDHKVLCWFIKGRDRRRIMTIMSAEMLEREHNRLVLGAKVEFETSFIPNLETRLELTEEQLRVQVMVIADGHLDDSGEKAVIKVRKTRKIERVRYLLNAAEIQFIEHQYDSDIQFRFTPPIYTKSYRDFWYCSAEQLSIISEECLHWDGNLEDSYFYTRDKESADFIHYVFSVSGFRSTLREDTHYRDGKIDYRVFAISTTKTGLMGVPKSEIKRVPSQDGRMYCFTVPSGFWVMRRNGNIVMTGNCGMQALKTNLTASQLPDNLHFLRTRIESSIPHGRTDNGGINDRGAWGDPSGKLNTELHSRLTDIYKKHTKLERAAERAPYHLGTLGTGNHFIELCLDENQSVWIMLHSGSRGIGNAIGSYFITLAKQDMKRWFINLPDQDLAYFPEGSENFDDYLNAVSWAQDFALANRNHMMNNVLTAIGLELDIDLVGSEEIISCHHNYVERENHFGHNVLVTRKGAVRARTTDLGIIPGSMGVKSYIVRGKGNPDSFNSCSHGAGRAMSRGQAKKTFTLEDHNLATTGVECRKDLDVIDETPGAYKNIDQVMSSQTDLIEIVHTLKQVLCVKG